MGLEYILAPSFIAHTLLPPTPTIHPTLYLLFDLHLQLHSTVVTVVSIEEQKEKEKVEHMEEYQISQ